jgi:hypothetical protein
MLYANNSFAIKLDEPDKALYKVIFIAVTYPLLACLFNRNKKIEKV